MKRTQALLFILTFFVSPHLHAEAGADADEATSSVSMTDSDILEMHVGECCQLHTDIVPSDEQADGDFSVSWSSSHSGLWVDECGFITALTPCQATVVCTSSAGCDSCNIVVKPTTDGVLPCYGSESTVQLSSHSEDDAFRLSLVDDVLTVSCEFMADAGADGIISYAVCQNTIFLDIHTGHTDDTASCILRGTEFQIRDCTADYYYIYIYTLPATAAAAFTSPTSPPKVRPSCLAANSGPTSAARTPTATPPCPPRIPMSTPTSMSTPASATSTALPPLYSRLVPSLSSASPSAAPTTAATVRTLPLNVPPTSVSCLPDAIPSNSRLPTLTGSSIPLSITPPSPSTAPHPSAPCRTNPCQLPPTTSQAVPSSIRPKASSSATARRLPCPETR